MGMVELARTVDRRNRQYTSEGTARLAAFAALSTAEQRFAIYALREAGAPDNPPREEQGTFDLWIASHYVEWKVRAARRRQSGLLPGP